jgi:hypothetical protein
MTLAKTFTALSLLGASACHMVGGTPRTEPPAPDGVYDEITVKCGYEHIRGLSINFEKAYFQRLDGGDFAVRDKGNVNIYRQKNDCRYTLVTYKKSQPAPQPALPPGFDNAALLELFGIKKP